MSRFAPINKMEAFTYQLEDDIQVLRASSLNKKEYASALKMLNWHIEALQQSLDVDES